MYSLVYNSPMKINIIGASGSGKTTLASKLADKLEIDHLSSDHVFFKQEQNKKHRTKRPVKERENKLNDLLALDEWIYEGKHIIPRVFEKADKIIWLKFPFFVALFRQWKRYFTDPAQRKEYGLRNNLRLSIKILRRQYYGKVSKERFEDPSYAHRKKISKMLEPYHHKTTILKSNQEINNFVKNICNKN